MDVTVETQAKQTGAAAQRGVELAEKQRRILALLEEQGRDALLIARNENVAWATAGIVDMRVGMHRETGPGMLLFTRDGRRFYLTTENEGPRFAAEEFAGLGYEPLLAPWYANDPERTVRSVVASGRVASDVPFAGEGAVALTPVRSELTDGEVERYRWLGRQAAEVATRIAEGLEPGVSEREMQARLAAELIARGITPSVFLCAVDDRILAYRHAVPRNGRLERFGMVGFCARYTGLAVSITRFVHFGAMPAALEQRFPAMARVAAQLLAGTRPGATGDALFHVAASAYAAEGMSGAERLHHQGGATGYNEREWVARPGGAERVLERQAFAWNPNFEGAKVEDTVIAHNGAMEVLTSTPAFPQMQAEAGGREFVSAGVLRR